MEVTNTPAKNSRGRKGGAEPGVVKTKQTKGDQEGQESQV